MPGTAKNSLPPTRPRPKPPLGHGCHIYRAEYYAAYPAAPIRLYKRLSSAPYDSGMRAPPGAYTPPMPQRSRQRPPPPQHIHPALRACVPHPAHPPGAGRIRPPPGSSTPPGFFGIYCGALRKQGAPRACVHLAEQIRFLSRLRAAMARSKTMMRREQSPMQVTAKI